jgi:hypothetical protein
MRHILLLGAGFSRNWGGFLASEVFDYLFGCAEVLGDTTLKQLLWDFRLKGGFESTLQHLQSAARHSGAAADLDRLDRFQRALLRMFGDMNAAFAAITDFERQTDVARMLGTFLHRFDAIFSLNQDVLMERHYLNMNLALSHSRRWSGPDLPGMKPDAQTAAGGWGDVTWRPRDRGEFKVASGAQPFFKLHGSSNWFDAEGKGLLIMGGDKGGAISLAEVLSWYQEEFKHHLTGEQSRLMVMGYGFNDDHISEIIGSAADGGNLGLFIVDPLGPNVLLKGDPRAQIPEPEPLRDRLRHHVIGFSSRDLRGTFSGDEAERLKMMRFFNE